MLFPNMRPWAQASIAGSREYPGLGGLAAFYPVWNGVLIAVQLWGLPEQGSGFFAMHIHEGDNCTGTDFSHAGGHFNPGGREHPEHAGDLPTLLRCGGRAYLAFVTDRFTVEDVIGRTLVIHGDADDFRSQPAGNSGSRIGCGVIRRE